MTNFKTGDKGQRYEVRYKTSLGFERVMGWARTLEGVNIFKISIKLHPAMHSPRVIDRQKQNEN